MTPTERVEVGRAISTSVQELGKLCEDIDTMFRTLDTKMAETGWHMLSGKVDDDGDRRVGRGSTWWPRVVGRGYSSELEKGKDKTTPVSCFRFVEVHLAPEFSGEPMVVFGRVSFSVKTAPWHAWRKGIGEVLDELPAKQPFELSADAFSKAVDNAKQIVVQAIPLLEIQDDSAVLKHVLHPLQQI